MERKGTRARLKVIWEGLTPERFKPFGDLIPRGIYNRPKLGTFTKAGGYSTGFSEGTLVWERFEPGLTTGGNLISEGPFNTGHFFPAGNCARKDLDYYGPFWAEAFTGQRDGTGNLPPFLNPKGTHLTFTWVKALKIPSLFIGWKHGDLSTEKQQGISIGRRAYILKAPR